MLIEELGRDGRHIGGQPFLGPPTLLGALGRSKAAYEAIDGTRPAARIWPPRLPFGSDDRTSRPLSGTVKERIRRATERGEVYIPNTLSQGQTFASQPDSEGYEYAHKAQATVAPSWRDGSHHEFELLRHRLHLD